jgi:hypothetical protein
MILHFLRFSGSIASEPSHVTAVKYSARLFLTIFDLLVQNQIVLLSLRIFSAFAERPLALRR